MSWESVIFETLNSNNFHTEHFVNKWKQDIWDNIVDLNSTSVVNEDGSTDVELTPTIHFIYLFIHLYYKFLNGRDITEIMCVWARFVDENYKDIIKDSAYAILDRLGLVRACCSFDYILENKLRVTCFPLHIKEIDRQYGERIANELFVQKGCGIKRLIKFFWLSPWENI